MMRSLLSGVVFAVVVSALAGCAVRISPVATVGGGPNEAWIVMEEKKGDNVRFAVYRCAPEGCRHVGVLAATEWKDDK